MDQQGVQRAGDTVLVDRPASRVMRIRLNRPQVLNAIDEPLVSGLLRAFKEANGEVIVLSSSTERAFSAGADVTLADLDRANVSNMLYELYQSMVSLAEPIIAAVEGHAVGAGAQLTLASDLRIGGATTEIRFVGPEFGLAVGGWGLPSVVGRGRAMDLCLTGRSVGAQEALSIGLLDRIVDDPPASAIALARRISELEVDAVSRVKRIVNASLSEPGLSSEAQGNRERWSGSTKGTRV